MTDSEAQQALARIVVDWLAGSRSTAEFINQYWENRRRLLQSNWSAFTAPFGAIMSAMDTAADSYSPKPDWHQIDELNLRERATAVIEELRQRVPDALAKAPPS